MFSYFYFLRICKFNKNYSFTSNVHIFQSKNEIFLLSPKQLSEILKIIFFFEILSFL